MKRVIVIFFLTASFIQSIAQDPSDPNNLGQYTSGDNLNTITTAVPFLLISPDSRSGAMGDVGVATSPDANSMHWNPAKLSFTENDLGVSVSVVPWLRELVSDINLQYIGGYAKLNDNDAIGYELRYFTLGDIIFTGDNGETIGQYKPHEMAFGTAYSRKLSRNFSIAISGRYIYSNLTGGVMLQSGLETVAGQSIAADISSYTFIPIKILKKESILSLGMNISNIGSKMSYTETTVRDFIPINLRFGTDISTKLDDYNKISFAIDLNKLLVPSPPAYDVNDIDEDLDFNEIIAGKDPDVAVVSGIFQSFGDAPGGFKEEIREINISTGMEYWYDNQFAIRAGYFYEHWTKGGREYLTFGSGVKYNVFALDFSYLVSTSNIGGTNPLSNTMRFTLVFDLGSIQ